jgi:hypothetical protein
MAYFAKLGTGNIIEQVISIDNSVIIDANGVEQEQLGVDFINKLYNTRDVWKQTSYNTKAGVHVLGGIPFRKNYAGIGFIYDEARDAFVEPKPHNSWILNESTCRWESPIPKPNRDGLNNNQIWVWNEQNKVWDLTII